MSAGAAELSSALVREYLARCGYIGTMTVVEQELVRRTTAWSGARSSWSLSTHKPLQLYSYAPFFCSRGRRTPSRNVMLFARWPAPPSALLRVCSFRVWAPRNKQKLTWIMLR